MNYGSWGLFIHSFADAIIFPIPAFFLQISLSLLDPARALWFATVGYIACLLGTPIGFLIGKMLGHSIMQKLLQASWIDRANQMFTKNGEIAILFGSFTPIPFKVFTILSGCLNFSLWRLIVYAALGRAIKFYAVGTLFYLYGKSAESMVPYVSMYSFIMAVPVLILFLLIRRKRRNNIASHPSKTFNPPTSKASPTTKEIKKHPLP